MSDAITLCLPYLSTETLRDLAYGLLKSVGHCDPAAGRDPDLLLKVKAVVAEIEKRSPRARASSAHQRDAGGPRRALGGTCELREMIAHAERSAR